MTLLDYFPKSYFIKHNVEVNATGVHGDRKSGHSQKGLGKVSIEDKVNVVKAGIISKLKDLPATTTMDEVLKLPQDVWLALLQVFIDPGAYEGKVFHKKANDKCVTCMATISFDDKDLQLGRHLHNRPLYVSGYICEHRIGRILIDGGSAVISCLFEH